MGVGAYHQRSADAAGAKELLGDPERIDEAGADRLHVERRALTGSEPCLQTTSGRRVDAIGGRRAHHDEVQRRGIDPGRVESVARSAFGKITGRPPPHR